MSNFRKSILIFGAILLCVGAALVTFLALSFSGALVTEPIELVYQIVDEDKVYDGEPLTPQECLLMSGELIEGHVAEISLEGSQTNVGASKSGASVRVRDEKGFDVTGDYKIRVEGGRLTVTPQEIYILLNAEQVVYGGEKIVFDEYSVVMGNLASGHTVGATLAGAGVINVGDTLERTDVFPAIYDANGRNVTSNYEPYFAMGKVEVVPRPVTLKPASAEKIYDGTPLTCPKTEITAGTLVSGHYCVYSYSDEQGNEASLTTAGELEAFVGARVYDPLGNDVTANYAIDNTATATLKVHKRAMTVTGASRSWEYDGNSHNYYENGTVGETEPASAEGLAPGESVRVTYSGSLTELGEAENRIARCRVLDRDGLGETSSNYEISYVSGKLSVTKANLTVSLKNFSKSFDGAPYRANDPQAYYEFSPALPEGIVFESNAEEMLSQTVAGSARYTFTDYTVRKGAADLTDYYNVTVVPGRITVSPRRVSISTDLTGTVNVEYNDGLPCSFPVSRFTVTGESGGLLNGHAILSVTGDRALTPGSEVQRSAIGAVGITDAAGRNVSEGYEFVNLASVELNVLVGKKKVPVTVADYSAEYGAPITNEFLKTLITCGEPFTAADFTFGTETRKNAGEYALTPVYTGAGSEFYEPQITAGTLTIRPKKIAVTVSGTKNYDGKPFAANGIELKCENLPNGVTAKPGESVLRRTDAGRYENAEIVFTENGEASANYEAVVSGYYEIKKVTAYLQYADLGEDKAPDSKTYDGQPFKIDTKYLKLVTGSGESISGFEVISVVYDNVIKATANPVSLNLRYPRAVVAGGNGAEISSDNLEIIVRETDQVSVTIAKRAITFAVAPLTISKDAVEDDIPVETLISLVTINGLASTDYIDVRIHSVSVSLGANPEMTIVSKYNRGKICNELGEDVTDCYEIPSRTFGMITRV